MRKQIILFLVLAFSLNLVWEVSHSYLYDWDESPLKNNVQFYIPKILGATLGDLVILASIFLILSLIHQNLSWFNNLIPLDYIIITLLGLITAIIIEIRGVYLLNRWSYNELMPIIFGIGLTPLIQIVITTLLALWLSSSIK